MKPVDFFEANPEAVECYVLPDGGIAASYNEARDAAAEGWDKVVKVYKGDLVGKAEVEAEAEAEVEAEAKVEAQNQPKAKAGKKK